MTAGRASILRGADVMKLSSTVAAVRAIEAGGFSWDRRARVRVLRNFTAEPLRAPLALLGYRRGIAIDVSFSDFDAYAQDIVGDDAPIDADLVVLALWLDELRLAFAPSGEIDADAVIDHVTSLVTRLLARAAGLVALSTFTSPRARVGDPKDDVALATINLAVMRLAERSDRVVVVDVRRLVERLGEGAAIDARGALTHAAPVAHALAALWAEALVDAIAARQGAGRKVLALDCDGTLWGGVVGEDGLDGIRLSSSDYPGRAFVAFQEQVVALARAGVMIALVSKNEEADVMRVLEQHPACRLRPEHIAKVRIDWSSKVENLRAIADELHVGLDSFVLIDDSPYECAMVREALPMVDVRRVPEHASDLPSLLRDARSTFGARAPTKEDLSRAESMREDDARTRAARAAVSLEAFLTSLELHADIGPPNPASIARVAQLTQRTNQFNATTRRYDISDVERFLSRQEAIVLAMRARDRFGDLGLVGVAIAVREGGFAQLDTLLLSCRALGRRLEDALLSELVAEIGRRFGPMPLRLEHVATPKNAQVARFFEARGLPLASETDGRRVYEARDPTWSSPPFITVTRRET